MFQRKLFEQLTSACERKVPLSVPKVPNPEEDLVLTEEVFHPVDEEEVGSITSNMINSFIDGASVINCDTTHTIWMQFYETSPKLVSKNIQGFEEVNCEVVLVRTGTIDSTTTTGNTLVTYTFNTQFEPFPKCELTVQVAILFAFIQVKVLHDSALGDLALPEGLGADLVTNFPA